MFGFLKRLFGKGSSPPVFGLTSWRSGKGQGNLPHIDVPVAMVLPMVVMMQADNLAHEEERKLIHALCQMSPVFQNPSWQIIERWIGEAEKILTKLDKNDMEACLMAKRGLTPALCQTAFAFALLISYADHRIEDAEKKKADEIAKWLQIDEKTALKIHEVVDILRHGPFAK